MKGAHLPRSADYASAGINARASIDTRARDDAHERTRCSVRAV